MNFFCLGKTGKEEVLLFWVFKEVMILWHFHGFYLHFCNLCLCLSNGFLLIMHSHQNDIVFIAILCILLYYLVYWIAKLYCHYVLII